MLSARYLLNIKLQEKNILTCNVRPLHHQVHRAIRCMEEVSTCCQHSSSQEEYYKRDTETSLKTMPPFFLDFGYKEEIFWRNLSRHHNIGVRSDGGEIVHLT